MVDPFKILWPVKLFSLSSISKCKRKIFLCPGRGERQRVHGEASGRQAARVEQVDDDGGRGRAAATGRRVHEPPRRRGERGRGKRWIARIAQFAGVPDRSLLTKYRFKRSMGHSPTSSRGFIIAFLPPSLMLQACFREAEKTKDPKGWGSVSFMYQFPYMDENGFASLQWDNARAKRGRIGFFDRVWRDVTEGPTHTTCKT